MTAPAMPSGNPFATEIVTTFTPGEVRPSLAALGLGRLVIMIPKGEVYQEKSKFKDPKTGAERMANALLVDILICDGPEIMFGGDPDEGIAHTHRTAAPTWFANQRIMGDRIIDQIVTSSRQGVCLGRLGKKPSANGGRAMWELIKPSEQDVQIALPVYTAFVSGQFPQAEIIQFGVRPGAAYPPPMAPQFQPQAAPAMPQWPAAQPAVVAQPMAYTPPPPPVAPAQPAWQAGPIFPPAPVVEADWTLNTMPPGFPGSPEQWTGATREQRQQFLAQAGITGPQQAMPQPTGL